MPFSTRLGAQLAVAGALVWAAGCAGSVRLRQEVPPPGPAYVHAEPGELRKPLGPPSPPLPPWPPAQEAPKTPHPKPVAVEDKNIRGQAVTVVRLDLRQVEPHIAFAYATGRPLRKVEAFSAMWQRHRPFVVATGTFYGIRTRETMGTLISGGRIHQAPGWDDRGTALVVGRDGRARMVTLRAEGRPNPPECRFWLQAGPRLVRNKQIWYRPQFEGFGHPTLFARNRRVVVGTAGHGRTLLLIAFRGYPTLPEAAQILRDIGVSDAMNLDGGPSAGLAVGDRLVLAPDSPLTHVLVMKPRSSRLRSASSRAADTP